MLVIPSDHRDVAFDHELLLPLFVERGQRSRISVEPATLGLARWAARQRPCAGGEGPDVPARAGGRPNRRFYALGDVEEFTLPPEVDNYVVHPVLARSVGLTSVRTGP